MCFSELSWETHKNTSPMETEGIPSLLRMVPAWTSHLYTLQSSDAPSWLASCSLCESICITGGWTLWMPLIPWRKHHQSPALRSVSWCLYFEETAIQMGVWRVQCASNLECSALTGGWRLVCFSPWGWNFFARSRSCSHGESPASTEASHQDSAKSCRPCLKSRGCSQRYNPSSSNHVLTMEKDCHLQNAMCHRIYLCRVLNCGCFLLI